MARRIVLALIVLAALALAVRYLLHVLASDETRLRWLVAGMEEAYNAGSPGGCVEPLARDWRHAGNSIDRQLLLRALFQVSRERDLQTRALLSRVEVDEQAAAITIDGERATLECEAVFSRLRRGEWEVTWRARFAAELEERDGDWVILRSRHADLSGTHLGR